MMHQGGRWREDERSRGVVGLGRAGGPGEGGEGGRERQE